VPVPVTAAAREAVQHHIGRVGRIDPANLERDFGMILETVADGAGIALEPENVPIPTGLEVGE
jgi:3-hydroxyisobutyrate dehydrogenase